MTLDKSSDGIREMFAAISPRYDFLNHLLSLGVDRSWRRRTVELVPPVGEAPILDVCTGTADLTLDYWRASRGRVPIVGTDFCQPMLEIGLAKCRRRGADGSITLKEADTRQLPFADDTFQIVCVAFGLRNVRPAHQGLREMVRVCRPGGRVAVLEFSMPSPWVFGSLYKLYFRWILPLVGQALARNRQRAYNYLPASVGQFPQDEAFAREMHEAGLRKVEQHPFTFGIATLYVGEK